MENPHSHVWMFPNSNDNRLLGGVLAIDKIKFVKNHWEHPDGTPIDYEKEIQKYYRNWNRFLKLIEVKK